MEDGIVLVDTSIVIDYIRSADKENTSFIKLFKQYELCISVISVFELNNGATTPQKQKDVATICENIEIIDFDYAMSQEASEIYRYLKSQNKLIEFRDILIAATALARKIKIATKNHKDFSRILNLAFIDVQ